MKKIVVICLTIQFYFSQDKGLALFEKKEYKQSYDYYLNVLKNRKNDISAKFGAGISAFKNQDIETAMQYLQEVSKSGDGILASKAHFNLANIYKDQKKLKESIYHYKKAIELNSSDKDAKINFELLKKMLEQEEKKENQSDQGDEGDEGDEKKGDKENQSDQGDEGDEKKGDKESQSDQGDEGDEKKGDKESQSNQGGEENKNWSDSKELSDKEIQAEAILNALKDQEKINQKQKLLKVKAKTLEKDW